MLFQEKEDQLKSALGEDYEEYVAYRSAKWVGPFTINELLDSCLDYSHVRLPESNGVYLISRETWNSRPDNRCVPLYVGVTRGLLLVSVREWVI